MLRSISFKAAWDGHEQYSHFIKSNGDVYVTDKGAEFAKVCVIANSLDEVTQEQTASIITLCEIVTAANPHVCITLGPGLSPFRHDIGAIECVG